MPRTKNSNKGLAFRKQLRQRGVSRFETNGQRIRHLLQYGILAPSTHNTQPWIIKIQGDTVKIYADFAKRIPEADPSGRDLYMSLGALIKNIELAAEGYGVRTRLDIFAKPGRAHVATLEFKALEKMAEEDPALLGAILKRQNYRGFFDDKISRVAVSKVLDESCSGSTEAIAYYDSETREKLADLTVSGLKLAYSKPEFRREISSYINHNLSRKRHGLHGYSLRMNLPVSLVIPRVMKRKDIGAKLASLNYKSFISAPAVVVLTAKDSEADWIEAGRSLERIMVGLSAAGISSSIYAAAIEMSDLRGQLASIVATNRGKKPQLLVCIGHADDDLPYSVRKELRRVIKP